ncbi:uncharacterized protein [Rutidosis leptorrhynchoides]|uniref:uncharacterized protein n=1 Tax=Rutidosis leptorrhynchoides TaxID=125765 RepID=UPI003A994D5A
MRFRTLRCLEKKQGLLPARLMLKKILLGDQPLCVRYNRIFRLEVNKDATIRDRILRNSAGLDYSWNWNREPRGRSEAELHSLIGEISSFGFGSYENDSWKWLEHSSGILHTHALATIINNKLLVNSFSSVATLRNRLLPQKIEVFIWRAQRNRLPVRTELDKRGIDLDSARCPVCDNEVETLEHMLIHCTFAKDLWLRFFKWWKVDNFQIQSVNDIASGPMSHSHNFPNPDLMTASMWVCAYKIWYNRNNKLFNKTDGSSSFVLQEVQSCSFKWISIRDKKHSLDWIQWFTKPIECKRIRLIFSRL